MQRAARVGILLSGRGSNFAALLAAMKRGEMHAEVALVVSNRCGAAGIELAAAETLRVAVIPHRGEPSRESHEVKVLEALRSAEVEWICLAGYMRLLSAHFVSQYPRRILNIHPSLLPAFPGLDAQKQALDHGVRVSGCTVHLVDEGLDSGPIVVQRAVPVHDDDTPESLSARILEQEHIAYPEALQRLIGESWEVEGRRVRFNP